MGTSSLYGGLKKTVLLPDGYSPETEPTEVLPDESQHDGETPEESIPNEVPSVPQQPSVTWGTVRRSMSTALSNRTRRNVKMAISNYAKALGGHKNATRQATTVKKTATRLISYFSGTPEDIRVRFEEAGISFEGRATKDIFSDISGLLAPVPNDLEDSLANKALRDTIAELVADESIDLSQLDNFNEALLQRLVGGLVKHYIFDKLIQQSGQTALKNCDNTAQLLNLEKEIKKYIDGIVDSVIPDLVHTGISQSDFDLAVEAIFDTAYQQMEDLL